MPPTLPEEIAPVFDLPAMAEGFQAPEIWFGSRLSIDHAEVSFRESDLVLRALSGITADTVGDNPNNLMIGVMEERLRRLYRRYGVHWNTIDTVEILLGHGLRMHRAWVRAGDLQ